MDAARARARPCAQLVYVEQDRCFAFKGLQEPPVAEQPGSPRGIPDLSLCISEPLHGSLSLGEDARTKLQLCAEAIHVRCFADGYTFPPATEATKNEPPNFEQSPSDSPESHDSFGVVPWVLLAGRWHVLFQASFSAKKRDLKVDPFRGRPQDSDRDKGYEMATALHAREHCSNVVTALRELYEESMYTIDLTAAAEALVRLGVRFDKHKLLHIALVLDDGHPDSLRRLMQLFQIHMERTLQPYHRDDATWNCYDLFRECMEEDSYMPLWRFCHDPRFRKKNQRSEDAETIGMVLEPVTSNQDGHTVHGQLRFANHARKAFQSALALLGIDKKGQGGQANSPAPSK